MQSPLTDYTAISPNRNSPRNRQVDRITVHCTVGQMSVETLGSVFAKPSRQASSNYGIGPDGRVGLYCPEGDRSWCSSSGPNDNRAITIEVASDAFHPYAVTPEAFAKLLDLCEDICRRYGKKKLLWFGDRDKTLSYAPEPDEMVMTVHRWFANKACPGDYLYERHPEIAAEVTRRLEDDMTRAETEALIREMFPECMAIYKATLAKQPADAWAMQAIEKVKAAGLMVGDPDGNFRAQSEIKREEAAVILANMLPDG